MSATLETLRSELRSNRVHLDNIATGPTTLESLMVADLRHMRRLALLDRINEEIDR